MKTYKSSDLTNKRSEVMREAEKGGVIIQECRTNGDVRKEFVLFAVNSEETIETDILSRVLLSQDMFEKLLANTDIPEDKVMELSCKMYDLYNEEALKE